MRGVQRRQPRTRTQMPLSIGLQRKATLRHRLTKAHGGDHVVQWLAGTHMHLHMAGRDQGQTRALRQLLQAHPLQCVVHTQSKLRRQPDV